MIVLDTNVLWTLMQKAVDVTLAELAIELFFPADAATADNVRSVVPIA